MALGNEQTWVLTDGQAKETHGLSADQVRRRVDLTHQRRSGGDAYEQLTVNLSDRDFPALDIGVGRGEVPLGWWLDHERMFIAFDQQIYDRTERPRPRTRQRFTVEPGTPGGPTYEDLWGHTREEAERALWGPVDEDADDDSDLDDEGYVSFQWGHDYNMIDPGECIPYDTARAALEEFLTTGQQPTKVTWVER